MNEYVLVNFAVDFEEADRLLEILKDLGTDFDLLDSNIDWETDDSAALNDRVWRVISGRIRTESATIIKLRHPWIADKMIISYIPSDMKDQYRR